MFNGMPMLSRIQKLAARIGRLVHGREVPATPQDSSLDEYVNSYPSNQNSIDILPGWNTALPPEAAVTAGSSHLYQDGRVLWALEQFGNLAGKNVLEIGPLEASHTYMLEQHAPAVLDVVEANKLSFLRCLVVKELLNLKIARFLLGDGQLWLENSGRQYDLIVASGVLYHMQDPIRMLEAMAACSDTLFLWTHYVEDSAMPVGDPRRGALLGEQEIRQHRGIDVRLYPRTYYGAWQNKSFCGGMHDLHRWMHRADILALLTAMGYDDIRIWGDQTDHPNGPAFSIFAQRPTAAGRAQADNAN